METAPLKSFATWARTALIGEVTAQIAVVAAPASNERVEQPRLVDALEKAVNAAGGGDKGRAAVADRVAYTWFNRIIALRFMDANGYTGIGVVSPQTGVAGGQPEVLAEAKRGNIDAQAVGQKTADTVTALLNGTRRSDDPQGEAYALLLADYCRYWNRSMPFMFEREGDFTELLIPANLLADDSVLNRAATVLTEHVCKDVEVIGWLYQFYISERKDEVFAGFKKNKKAGADEIPAATQLFTPHWIVRYLVENSLGRLWMLNHPTSHLVDKMDYYIAPVDEETEFLKISSPEELKIIDPACGSGHMLTYAFDLLYAIYEEEGYAPSDIPGLILANNLYGTEIDPRAGALAAFALVMKARERQRTFFNKQVEPNVCVLQPVHFTADELDFLVTTSGDRDEEITFWNQFEKADTFGSLIQPDPDLTARLSRHLETLDSGGDLFRASIIVRAVRAVHQSEYLLPRYAVVNANPPYMGAKNMGPTLAGFVRSMFPRSKADLFAAFVERSLTLGLPGALAGLVTMHSWMFLSSFERLRGRLLTVASITNMAHLGTRAFDSIGGAVVATTAFVLSNRPSERSGVFIRLVDGENESQKSNLLKGALGEPESNLRFERASNWFRTLPGSPISYWLSDAMLKAFVLGHPVANLAELRQGLLTGDNETFVRHWWEVSRSRTESSCDSRAVAASSKARWFPFNKGGEFRRWYGNHEHVVNWEDDGRAIRTFGVEDGGKVRSRPQNLDYYFRPTVSWSNVGTDSSSFRAYPPGFIAAGSTGDGVYSPSEDFSVPLLGFLNSSVAHGLLAAIAPTITFNVGTVATLPIVAPLPGSSIEGVVRELIEIARDDWNQSEVSWGFDTNALIACGSSRVEAALDMHYDSSDTAAARARLLETKNNESFAELYGLTGEVETCVELGQVSLNGNSSFRFGPGLSIVEYRSRFVRSAVQDLVSYAVGCMFGRYSLDSPGLILKDQRATLESYRAEIPQPTFTPDADNVIPIVDGDWFGDDIVARFREFLRVAFGEQHFEENLRFVIEALGVKDLRAYFVKSFYKDHVQRYKKRPIYWLFSSPKGSFNALIYMHRYTESTASTVLNEYLREFKAKLDANLQHQERLATGGGDAREQAKAQKEADRLRKVILELDEYEHDVLYPLASQQVAIDLDDGVKANYPKLGAALKKIPGLEASDE